MVARERRGDISPGVPTNCRLALLLWTFNNNKSQPPSPAARQFSHFICQKRCVLPSAADPICTFLDVPPPNAVHLLNDFIKERTFSVEKASIIEEGADLIHF